MSKPFMDQDFLLSGETARTLYHQHAAPMPIIDYHCHIDPKAIYEDQVFDNLAQAWLGGDHYKWRAMRSCGVAEKYITGDASPYEKFLAWAGILPQLIGNPLYHWTHLELQRYFDIHEPLNQHSAPAIWEKANALLPGLSVRQLIKKSRVEVICTTDDPVDDLAWHQKLASEANLPCRVLPAFRPDRALNIDKPGFASYLQQLGQASGQKITSLSSLKAALDERLQFFVSQGCTASDHGLDYIMFEQGPDCQAVLEKALAGQQVSRQEADAFKTELMVFLAGRYRELGVVMQLHYGAVRNNNPLAYQQLGPDTGFDAIWGAADSGARLGALLGRMEEAGGLPKTIIYSLNPTDNAQIGAMIGCFQGEGHRGKVQHGSAWWFNDSKTGMQEQLTSLANLSALGNFVGMLTDSRSFLSYTRHEYFRRVLCELLGSWVDQGEYPRDLSTLGQMVEDISYNNTKQYFGF